MTIANVSIPYPDFKLNELIDPEQFDLNNEEFTEKLNLVIELINQISESVTDGASGADKISLTQIAPFASTKLQAFLEEVVSKLRATTDSASGADFVASTTIPGVSGTTVQAQLESLKGLLDGVYTKVQLDAGQLDTRYLTKAQLQSTVNGSSGADAVKTATIEGVPGSTVREVLQNLKYQINSAVTGQIPDGSITEDKLAFDIATDAQSVSIVDSGNKFTATDVEGALLELFTLANSVKTNVSNAIGSPATPSDTGAVLAGHINTEKANIASNVGDGTGASTLKYLSDRLGIRMDELATVVNAKGVTATNSDTLAQLITKVGNIASVTTAQKTDFINAGNGILGG